MKQPPNPQVLDPQPQEVGFLVGKNWDDPNLYAAVPFGNQLIVIHHGEQLKVCRNRQSAMNFIERHRKGQSVAKLPI